jgi:hypothetical protein
MNRVPKSHHTERIGIYGVGAKVHRELGWEFRELTGDFGIDAEIEVITDGEPTGKIIAVQIKSGPSYFAVEDATEIVFQGELKHLTYWLDHKLPVIVVLYHTDRDTAYWQHVSEESIIRLPKTWKMSIPRNQTIEAAHITRLEQIASSDTKELVAQLKQELREYRCPFCGAPVAERGGDWVGSEHYGLHEIFECGYHALDWCVERPCPSDPRFPRFEDYALESHPSSSEPNPGWLCLAIPKTDMARRLPLGHGVGRTKEEAEGAVREKYDRSAVKWGSR